MKGGGVNVEFTITEQHIAQGDVKKCDKCPAALSILEKAAQGVWIGVAHYHISFIDVEDFCVRLNTPTALRHWIKRFDDGLVVAPLVFSLDVPERFLKAS